MPPKTTKKAVKKVPVKTPKIEVKETIDETLRKIRGLSERIFLVLTHDFKENDLVRDYDVMGKSGNVYKVSIKKSPTCTCPDHKQRFKRCKHIYFVLTRIMKVKKEQEDYKEYSDSDLKDMFNNIPQIVGNLKADPSILSRYENMKKNNNGEIKQREITDEDMCPICLGNLKDTEEELSYCKYSCGTSIHKLCFDVYNKKRYDDIKCLFCQKCWTPKTKCEYINLM